VQISLIQLIMLAKNPLADCCIRHFCLRGKQYARMSLLSKELDSHTREAIDAALKCPDIAERSVLLHKAFSRICSPSMPALFASAKFGHTAALRALLMDPATDVNVASPKKQQTGLFIAALYGHDEGVKLLLKAGLQET
jgi:hypothetical protein